jgi:hypothetical protein
MLIEVSLIQRLTLFLGYPTHSLTVTLFALLVSSGIGSLLTGPPGRTVEARAAHVRRRAAAAGGVLRDALSRSSRTASAGRSRCASSTTAVLLDRSGSAWARSCRSG